MSGIIDLGKTPLRNPRTGDIYRDEDGNVIMIENDELAMQECKVALETIRGEERYDDDYGFPLYDVIKNSYNLDSETLVRSAVLGTLTGGKVSSIQDADMGSMEYDDGVYYVDIIISTVNGVSLNLPFEVNL